MLLTSKQLEEYGLITDSLDYLGYKELTLAFIDNQIKGDDVSLLDIITAISDYEKPLVVKLHLTPELFKGNKPETSDKQENLAQELFGGLIKCLSLKVLECETEDLQSDTTMPAVNGIAEVARQSQTLQTLNLSLVDVNQVDFDTYKTLIDAIGKSQTLENLYLPLFATELDAPEQTTRDLALLTMLEDNFTIYNIPMFEDKFIAGREDRDEIKTQAMKIRGEIFPRNQKLREVIQMAEVVVANSSQQPTVESMEDPRGEQLDRVLSNLQTMVDSIASDTPNAQRMKETLQEAQVTCGRCKTKINGITPSFGESSAAMHSASSGLENEGPQVQVGEEIFNFELT